MWAELLTWLCKTAPEEAPPQKIAQLMAGLCSPERTTQRKAEMIVSRILSEGFVCRKDFTFELLAALAEQVNPARMGLVPRYVLLLADTGLSIGRPSPVRVAARNCLNHWLVHQDGSRLADTLRVVFDRPRRNFQEEKHAVCANLKA